MRRVNLRSIDRVTGYLGNRVIRLFCCFGKGQLALCILRRQLVYQLESGRICRPIGAHDDFRVKRNIRFCPVCFSIDLIAPDSAYLINLLAAGQTLEC